MDQVIAHEGAGVFNEVQLIGQPGTVAKFIVTAEELELQSAPREYLCVLVCALCRFRQARVWYSSSLQLQNLSCNLLFGVSIVTIPA